MREVLEAHGPETFFAVVATAGTTNFGIVDDLESVAEVCREHGIWLHVDGAYGGAGLVAPSVRELYAGIEHCDGAVEARLGDPVIGVGVDPLDLGHQPAEVAPPIGGGE